MPGFNIGNAQNGANNKTEYYRSHRWTISEIKWPDKILNQTGNINPASFACSINLPDISFEEETIKGGSIAYKIAKSPKWENITLKFYDVEKLYDAFYAWQNIIWDPTTGIKMASDYKSRIKLALRDGKGEIRNEFTLYNAYPNAISHGELSYTNSEIKLLNVTISFEYATATNYNNSVSEQSFNNFTSVTRGSR